MGGDGWHSRIESLKVLLTLDLDLDCDNFNLCSHLSLAADESDDL